MTPSGERATAPKRILFLSDMLWACAWYRCHVPGMELRRRGHDVRLQDTLEFEDIDWCDVLVMQRVAEKGIGRAVEYARSAGKLTVYDLDDDLWNIPESNPSRQTWGSERLAELAVALRLVDRVTTSTEPLARMLRAYNADVRVIPNMLPAEHWPEHTKDPGHGPPLVIGWAGGITHRRDLREVADVLEHVLERHPSVEVHLAGADPAWFAPHDRVRFLESVILPDYAALLSHFDIAIAPLHDSRFNESKSDLKVLEYSMIGLPVVASKVAPYSSSIRHGESGLLARNAKDWLKHLNALVEDAGLRSRLGSAARSWAETRTVERNIALWERVYGVADANG